MSPYREMAEAAPVGDEIERIHERILGTPPGGEVEVTYVEWMALLCDPEFVRLFESVPGTNAFRFRGRVVIVDGQPNAAGPW